MYVKKSIISSNKQKFLFLTVVRGCQADFNIEDTCSYGHCETCPSDKITDGCNSSFASKLAASIVLFALSILAVFVVK